MQVNINFHKTFGHFKTNWPLMTFKWQIININYKKNSRFLRSFIHFGLITKFECVFIFFILFLFIRYHFIMSDAFALHRLTWNTIILSFMFNNAENKVWCSIYFFFNLIWNFRDGHFYSRQINFLDKTFEKKESENRLIIRTSWKLLHKGYACIKQHFST